MKMRRAERILLAIGLTLVAVWIAARLHRVVSSRSAIARFEAGETTNPLGPSTAPLAAARNSPPVDFRLWSAQRISAYKDSLALRGEPALAILRIPKIHLEVPVFDGTDDLTLNRGVGRIRGTARIGDPGNLGIAGHRDGFFRGLEGMAPGDMIELDRPGAKDSYAVSEIRIVAPQDTSVLNPTPEPIITLSLPLAAQVQTSTTVTHGTPTKEVTVQRGEIVAISGNSVVIKMDDGTLREFDNVPDSTTFMVDGKPVNIKTAQVGMKLEKQTVTTTTPKVVTTVDMVKGKVWHVSPPNSVILTLENGQNQQFKIPQGQKFMVDGKETDAWASRRV